MDKLCSECGNCLSIYKVEIEDILHICYKCFDCGWYYLEKAKEYDREL